MRNIIALAKKLSLENQQSTNTFHLLLALTRGTGRSANERKSRLPFRREPSLQKKSTPRKSPDPGSNGVDTIAPRAPRFRAQ
jgi:hypothetical protein